MLSYRELQNICIAHSDLPGAPRCNSKRTVLEEWVKSNNLLADTLNSHSEKKPATATKRGAARITDFFSIFPDESPTDHEVSFSLHDNPSYPGLHLDYYPGFFNSQEVKEITDYLSRLIFAPKRQFNRYAKPPAVTSSRVFYAWFSDLPGAVHNFSKAHLNGFDPQEFTPMLEDIRTRIEETTGIYYNSLLVNFYPDGSSALSPHSDDSKWLGKDFDVPSLSFSAVVPNKVSPGERDIIFRGKPGTEAAGKKVKLHMGNGSLTIMRGASTQLLWTHEIPARANKGWRFNLTFRDVRPELLSENPRVQKPEEMRIASQEAVRPLEMMD